MLRRLLKLEKAIFFLWGCINIKQDFLINEQIKASTVQVISEKGERLGQMSIKEAIDKAYDEDKDLVLVGANSNPPVCKILDYSKFKFEMAKKEKEARKKQKTIEMKEIRITPNIDAHDFEFKCRNAKKFLMDGAKVKITVRFRGRELNYVKLGEQVLNKFSEELSEVATLEKKPLLEGKNLFIILAPNK